MFEHRIENDQEFAHVGREGHFFSFSRSLQALVEGFRAQHRLRPSRFLHRSISPSEIDGVLSSDFKVPCTRGLRVVDASVVPCTLRFCMVSAIYYDR